MKRPRVVAVVLALLAAAVAGCIPTLHPLYAPQDVRFDPALVGTEEIAAALPERIDAEPGESIPGKPHIGTKSVRIRRAD